MSGGIGRRDLRESAWHKAEGSWAYIRVAKKAYEAGAISLRDYRYFRNHADRARVHYQKIVDSLDRSVSCSTCARRVSEHDGGPADCNASDRMTEQDVDLWREGHCPYWLGKDEKEREDEDDMVRRPRRRKAIDQGGDGR